MCGVSRRMTLGGGGGNADKIRNEMCAWEDEGSSGRWTPTSLRSKRGRNVSETTKDEVEGAKGGGGEGGRGGKEWGGGGRH